MSEPIATSPEGTPIPRQVTLHGTVDRCWNCGNHLLSVEPTISGWDRYCPKCQHLTRPESELEQQLANLQQTSPGAIGLVVAAPFRIDLALTRPVDG